MEDLLNLIEALRSNGFDYDSYSPEYNPMEYFVDYVSPKEIVHSRIIAELLNPTVPHQLGDKVLQSFLTSFCPEQFANTAFDNVTVTTERPVATATQKRKIDICIEWSDHTKAVIIENKLNGACYQSNQLEDYYRSLKTEGYGEVYVVCIHKSKGLNDHNIPYANRVLYPIDIAECIEKAKQPLPFAVQSYVTLLKNMAKNNVIMQNATKLLELDDKTLNEIYQLAVAYNDIPRAKSELIENVIRGEYSNIVFNLKDGVYLQIWNEDDYKRHGCWVTVCVYRDRYGVFLTTTKGDSRANEYIEAAEYTHQESEGRYDWYYHKDATKRFFKNAELNEVINNVKALLNILAR